MSCMNLFKPAAIAVALLALSNGATRPALADYPDHPITAIVPFSSGAAVDIVARVISAHLSEQMKQPVLVVNKPGADAIIGFDYVAKAKPDGYTILFSGGAETKLPALHTKLPFDPVKDVVPVAGVGETNATVGVSGKLGANTLTDFIALAKKNPGKYNAAVVGNSTRMSVELFQLRAGVKFVQVNYAGTAEAATAVLNGEADLAIMDGLGFKSVMGSNGVKLLATAAPVRAFSDVPTTAEAGLPSFISGTTFGVFITGGTPVVIVQRLNAEINKTLAHPDVDKVLAPMGLEITKSNNTIDAYSKRYLSDLAMWKEVVRDAGIPTTD